MTYLKVALKRLLLISIYLLALTGVREASAQHKEAEPSSRYRSLSKRKILLDEPVADLLVKAEGLIASDPSSALQLVESALAKSVTEKDALGEAQSYLMLARINEGLEEWHLVAENYHQALLRTENKRQPAYEEIYVKSLTGLARSYNALNDPQQALDILSSNTKRPLSDSGQPEIHLTLADTYFRLKQYEEALNQANKAELSNQKDIKVRIKAVKAKILAALNELEVAEDLIHDLENMEYEGEESSKLQISSASLKESKEELVTAYKKNDRVQDELNFRNRSAQSNLQKGQPLQASKEIQAIGQVLIEQGQPDQAIEQLRKAAKIADSIRNPEQQWQTYRSLADAYASKGKTPEAILAYQKALDASERLQGEMQSKIKERRELIRQQGDIEKMTKDLALDDTQYELGIRIRQLRDSRLLIRELAIIGLALILLAVVIGAYFTHRNATKSKRMGQLLALKSLRSQMNPHFIFNALNSINQFISQNDERSANRFLSEFSKLMRLVLDNSQKDFITVQEEIEILTLYLRLEHYRFRDKFEYTFEVDPAIEKEDTFIPPMLVQPYIENAVWHGLRYRENKGLLKVMFQKEGNCMIITVKDDGIGRARSHELKTTNQSKHQSTGLKNIQERIEIINRVYHKNVRVEVSDVTTSGAGTQAIVIVPIEKREWKS